ncbi:nuclear transport factor 2 family protein [Streptacidiphilus carbonis]|uniref:nuclear transport factor 2 family protein n=1 Tax=Streptacidiphilus carbonis TaxID=105422 RepID=UPI0005A9FC3F|nr:nuclear transport factor 2 family protein [Streptacidiphilus carbonis]
MRSAPVTARLRTALNQADLLPLTPILHPDVHWSVHDSDRAGCHGRAEVLTRLAALHQHGGRVAMEETFTYPDAVVLGIGLSREGAPKRGRPQTVYTVFHLSGGLITRIHGHGDRYTALDAAYSASIHPHARPAPPATPAADTDTGGTADRRGAA